MGNLGVGSAAQYEEAGDMKILCLIAAERQASYPEIETCIEQDVDLNWIAPLVVWGPKDMAPELVEQINAATENMSTDEAAQAALSKADSAFAYYDVPSAQELIANEDAKIEKLANTLGLAPE
jgi:tripartite-type tricarboxylate transporter receptor subunit TctC